MGAVSKSGKLLMHDGADGTEKIEPLSAEPMPKSRKRKLNRKI
jgi:hypothetical protein